MNLCHILLALSALITSSKGDFNRCFVCRSRGELGSCKDPFTLTNMSALPEGNGVSTVPCTSGWCGKILDRGDNTFKDEEYGAATERLCLQRGPSDNEERCAQTTWGSHTKVYMCFCQGDLCNDSNDITPSAISFVLLIFAAIFNL